MQLNDEVIRAMGMGRVHKVTAGDDDSINLYSLDSGDPIKTLHSKKYGICKITFTHHHSAIVYASNKGSDHALRYLSLHDNRYIRYCSGHTARVTSLSMSPKSDLIMSTSQDRTMRLWDLRAQHCQGLLEVPSGIPTAAFDQQGMVFCVGIDSGILKLYDVRSFDKGPFTTFVAQDEVNSPASVEHVRFSADGKLLAVVVGSRVHLLDAFKGEQRHCFRTGMPEGSTAPEPCFSPDNRYILSGCEDKNIRVWDCSDGHEAGCWGGHVNVPLALKWAPRRCLAASACNALALWLPHLNLLRQMGLAQ